MDTTTYSYLSVGGAMQKLSFEGDGFEYFKIWLVNILLTIITVGIYLPWAKVRNKRYFYGNTVLDKHNFEYHATGKQLFFGYLIAMGVFIAFTALSNISPLISLVVVPVFLFAMPWVVWRSIKFNNAMSSYRNIRFGFEGKLKGAYIAFLAYPIGMFIAFATVVAVIIALGMYINVAMISGVLVSILALVFYPVYFAMINKVSSRYVINGSLFGLGGFYANLDFKTFLNITLKGMGLGLLVSLITVFLGGLLVSLTGGFDQLSMLVTQPDNIGEIIGPSIVISLVVFYMALFLIGLYVASYFKVHNQIYIFSKIGLGKSIRFRSSLEVNALFKMLVTNALLMMFTLGLAYPWTKVRKHRLFVENIHVDMPSGAGGYVSKKQEESPLGEELGEAFDLDIGAIGF